MLSTAKPSQVRLFLIFCLLFHCALSAAPYTFNLATTSALRATTVANALCNVQTTLDFQFSSSSTLAGTSAPYTAVGLSNSVLRFLDYWGNDLVLPLTSFAYDTGAFLLNYGLTSVSGITLVDGTIPTVTTPTAGFIFQFYDGSNTVYLYIPTITSSSTRTLYDTYYIDLTTSGAPSNSIGNLNLGAAALSAFNFIDGTNYNQFYSVAYSAGARSTLLVSSFYYGVSSSLASQTTNMGTNWTSLTNIDWSTAAMATGTKLCYAATFTTGNFQTHMRESYPLWFIWFGIFFFWVFYLLSEATTMEVYDKHYEDNRMTCWNLYSLYHLAHEQFFTRLSRETVLLVQWSIQGVFIASIIGNNYGTGPSIIIWSAVIAYVATIPFPFIIGALVFQKIYKKLLHKYEMMKNMKGLFTKEAIEPFEKQIFGDEEKIFGYYYWYYIFVFAVFVICWTLSINQMQKLPRQFYNYQYYWLAAMGISFALEQLILDPILAAIFGNNPIYRHKGGYFYDFKLGEAFRASQTS